MASFRYDDAAVYKHQRGREIQLVGKDGELVRLAVAIGVLADLDVRLPGLTLVHETVGIIKRLHHPGPSALVPRQVDRFYDVRLRGEKLEIKIRRHLREAHAVFRGEWSLKLDWLGAALV